MSDKKKHILIDVPMPVVTPRLILRPAREGDGAPMYDAIRETADELRPWMPWLENNKTPEDTEAIMREAAAKFILREDLFLVGTDRDTGAIVMSTGLHRMDWDAGDFEIGYWVRKSAHGKGYATESTNALIRYAFNALGATRVHITHADGNKPSEGVIRKLGFVHDGTLRKRAFMPDKTHKDLHVYSRLDDKSLPPLDVKWGRHL